MGFPLHVIKSKSILLRSARSASYVILPNTNALFSRCFNISHSSYQEFAWFMNAVHKLLIRYIGNCHTNVQHSSNNLSLCFSFRFPCIQTLSTLGYSSLVSEADL